MLGVKFGGIHVSGIEFECDNIGNIANDGEPLNERRNAIPWKQTNPMNAKIELVL